jgi:hypothetical protein
VLSLGRTDKRFLADERLYSHTEHCLQFLRTLSDDFDDTSPRKPERYHLYWYGTFSTKQAFAVKSFLATQDLKSSELWLWLDAEDGYTNHEDNPLLKPFLPFLHVKCFDPQNEAQNTPLDARPELYRNVGLVARSNFFRFVALYKYGGIYIDTDSMFLRDMSTLLRDKRFHDEFCYRWSAHLPYGNSAVLRLQQHSNTAHRLLTRCSQVNSCRPGKVLRFNDTVDLNLMVLPCPFFDPLWPHRDGRDRCEAAPFQRFGDFFRRFDSTFRRKPTISSYRDFFPGAFTYHWHNMWDADEYKDSYFGLFNQEFDCILRDRLAIK